MSRKDKPYLPLYVQDFMTDEKLMECSALATGVYVRIMCTMHKSEPYGTILLKQKDKQTDKQINNFALKLAKHLPYNFDTILLGLNELISENCLQIEGDFLKQKRMYNDGILSIKRSESGSIGGKKTQNNNKKFAKAKVEANSDIDNDNEINSFLVENMPTMNETDFLNFRKKMLDDGIFINPLMMNRGIKTKKDLEDWIDRYDTHISGEGKIQKDYSEYRKHFKNWILKQDTFGKSGGEQQKKMVL